MVVVLPSPGGVGDIAVTRMSLPERAVGEGGEVTEVDLRLDVPVRHQVLARRSPGLRGHLRIGRSVAALAISMSDSTVAIPPW